MRKIECASCTARSEGTICALPLDLVEDIRGAGSMILYRPRQILFGEGNPAGGLHLICQGQVKLYQSDRFGRERVIEIAGPGMLVGELGQSEDDTLSVSAEATEPSQICHLPRASLLPLLERHPEIGIRLIEATSRQLAIARRRIRDLVFKDASGRLASILLDLMDPADRAAEQPVKLKLARTRAELAQHVGVSTETVIRLLGRLSRKGIIDVDGRIVVVKDLARLERLAHSDEIET